MSVWSKFWMSTMCALALAMAATPVASEEKGAFSSADEAARQSSNPLGGDFFIFLNQVDNYFLNGNVSDSTKNINSWAMQPVIPIPMTDVIGENWIFVTRPTLPFIMNAEQPDTSFLGSGGPPQIPDAAPGRLPFRDKSGFGDISWFSLLGTSSPTDAMGGGDVVLAVGPTFQFPTASSEFLGAGKYTAGPSAVGAFIGRKFILGALFQHWESYDGGGEGANEQVSFSWLNLFYFLNLNDGWQVGGTPVITADWESDGKDERFTLPLGLGVYNTSFFGKMPIKMGVEMQWMPIQPDSYGQEFNIRFVVAPIIPSPFGSLAN
jgi:hypothetical protein